MNRPNPNSGFAINLDMSRYYDDLRKYSSVFVNFSKLKIVGDVENHIKYIFKLEENICLMNKKFLIPSCEDIHILQQYDTLRVQKCDFFDYQIHEETKKKNKPCDQTALNLIQSDKSIDLSCRPKQRMNTCHNNSITEISSTHLAQNCKGYFQALSTLQCFNGPDEDHKIQTKEKSSKKKRQSKVLDDCDDTNVLDMSVQHSKRKKRGNCFLSNVFTESYFGSTNDQSINNNDTDELNVGLKSSIYKLKKNNKKRKKSTDALTECQTVDLDHSGIENERKSAEIEKQNLNNSCEDGNECFNSELRYSKNISEGLIQEEFTSVDNFKSTVSYKNSKKKYKKNIILLKAQENEDPCRHQNFSEMTHNEDENDHKMCYSEFSHETSDICLDYSRDNTKLFESTPKEEKPDNCEKLDFYKFCVPNEEQVNNLLPHKIENKKQISSYQSCENIANDSLTEAITMKSFSQLPGNSFRRKRVRKHNKKKKREKIQYSAAVGPVLNLLAIDANSKPSPSPSDTAKHIYFTEDDFAEEFKIPSTPANHLQPTLDGSPELKDSNNTDEDSISLESLKVPSNNDNLLKTHVTWQENLLKLAEYSTKPEVFCRYASDPGLTYGSSTDFTPASKAVLIEHSSDVKPSVNINSKQNVENDIKPVSKTDVADTKVDEVKATLKNVISANYPIIDKVVSGDLILFKVLKLEDNQPGCSKTILAKVKDSSHFPEKIILHIIEGFEECGPFKKTVEHGETCVAEFRWTDILEPRLFYP